MNKVILCGRLTRNPDVRYSQGERQMAIARYTLAVDRRGGRRDSGSADQTADFISCVAFDKAAEFAEKYLKQGTKLIVTGHLQIGSYTNKEGQKVYTTDVIIEDQEFAESKASGSDSVSRERSAERTGRGTDSGDDFMTIPDGVEDMGLPFN